MTANDLLAISASCELSSTHPIGNSIVEAAEEKGLSIERPSKVEEIADMVFVQNLAEVLFSVVTESLWMHRT